MRKQRGPKRERERMDIKEDIVPIKLMRNNQCYGVRSNTGTSSKPAAVNASDVVSAPSTFEDSMRTE